MRLRRACFGLVFISFILMGVPMTALVNIVLAQPTTVLTPKWTRNSLGTNWEGGLVIGDVTGDGQEDVVYCGGSQDTIYVLDGDDGSTIATYNNGRIGTYTQPQLYDVDGDGVLDILVPLYYEPGLAAVQYDGDSSLYEMWEIYSQADQAPGGEEGSGSVMAKPVAGDIDGDGDLDIFLASQDIGVPGGYDGTIVRVDKYGNILYTTFTWRACSGGLSLGDTDNDGVFELYQGDRDMDYHDGGYGKGAKSYWADDLTERWIRLDDLTSSQAPVLADVNGDGIKDAIVGMYRCQWILNSTNGEAIEYWSDNDLSVHYGTTVYDIDGDGHLELLCNDGDHDDDAFTDVFDLVTGEMDAQLSLNAIWDPEGGRNQQGAYVGGDWKWSPVIADISPSHPGMEIITCPNGTGLDGGQSWNGAIMIFSYNGTHYESIQNVTRAYGGSRLGSQLGFPVVQDIDGDGYLELVTHSSYPGNVYAFDTEAPAPGYNEDELPGSQRIRSEVTYYGEARLGVAEHTIMPWGEDYWTAPLVAPISPADNALAVPISTMQLSFQLRDHQNESLTYSVTTSPDIGSITLGSINSGDSYEWNIINVDVSGLNYDTTYRWTVTADDGTNVTSRTYTFRTELTPAIGNHAPEQGDPLLESIDGLDTITSTFVCSNQTTTDDDGDEVTNIYQWMVEDESVAQLLLPFDLRNETSTKDYAYGNNGTVVGATWVPDGIVGGAYMFDGKDDAIIVSDGGLGYFNDHTYPTYPNHEELGGYGNWDEITVGVWIYLTEDNDGSRIVAKIPSYALGFESERTNRLYCAVWPYTGEYDPEDANKGSLDRMASRSANVNLDLDTWYYIAFTYENGVGLKLYLNGELVSQGSTSEGPLSPSRGEPVYIGRLVQPFAGMIDDVRIYSYAQSEEQIYNYYMDFINGTSNNSTFNPIGVGATGDELGCQIIPTDSYEEGTITYASIELQNSPPNAINPEIYPIRGRDLRLDDEDLTAGYEYSDPDGDAEGNSKIEWFMNGSSQPAFENDTEIPAASTAAGQEWNYTVTPQDSVGDFGDPVTSYTITIRDNVAPSTGTPDLESSGGADEDDEDLTATAVGSTDSDLDIVTNIYHWTLDSDPWMNLLVPFDTEVPLYLGANGTTLDYSGWGNDGEVVGARWVEDGIVGGAFSFDGDDFIRVEETGNSLGGSGWSQISVEFWVKATGTTSTEYVVSKHDLEFSTGGGGQTPYGVGYIAQFRAYNNRDRLYWYVYNASGSESVQFSDYDNFGEWHHVVCTYESGVGLKLYVDGLERDSAPFSGDISATLDGILDIGGYGSGGTDFSGLLDEVRIYRFALSSAQVFQRYLDQKDGLSGNETINALETAAGNEWVCEVIPSDSWEDGTPYSSAPLDVASDGNGRPVIFYWTPNPLEELDPSVPTEVSVDEGENLTLTHFSYDPDHDPLTYSWTLDTVEQNTTHDWTYNTLDSAGIHAVGITVTDPGALSAYHEWTVTVLPEVPPFNLTILPASNGTTDLGPGIHPYLPNEEASVTAIPDPGFILDYWLLDGVDAGEDNPFVITMTANHTLQPVFVEGQYTLTVIIVGDGTVTKAPDEASYDYGDVVTLTADPAEGWEFDGWSGDLTGSENPTTILMDENKTVTATFIMEEYTLTVNIIGDGSVDLNATGPYYYGDVVELTANPDPNWNFYEWTGDLTGPANPTTIVMDDNKTVDANFVEETYTLTVNVEGSGSVDLNNTGPYYYGDFVELTANADPGWVFFQWSEDLTGSANPETILIDANKVVNATFAMEEYTLTVNIIGNGAVDLNATAPYYYGDFVELTANPDLGWSFSGWSEDLSGSTNPETIVMDSDKTVNATFTEVPPAEQNAYLVVRGGNNRIYYRLYNTTLDAWDSWNVLPGSTVDSPAAVVCNNELHIVVRGSDGSTLWHGYVSLIDDTFHGWTRLSGWTPSAPALTSNGTVLGLVVRGGDNRIYYRSYNCTSDEWEGWIVVPTGVTCDSPAATILANELHIVVRGISATNSSMWHTRLNLTTETFSGWTRLSGATLSAPTLAASQTSNKLYLTVRGLNNSTYYNTWNGTGWEGWTVVPSGATCDGPAAAIIGDELRIVVRGMDGHSLWHYHINLSTSDHSGWTRINGATSSAPTLTS